MQQQQRQSLRTTIWSCTTHKTTTKSDMWFYYAMGACGAAVTAAVATLNATHDADAMHTLWYINDMETNFRGQDENRRARIKSARRVAEGYFSAPFLTRVFRKPLSTEEAIRLIQHD